MRNKIAELRLAPGQVGFYDELTNIHLTLTKPYANVYQGMNTSGLQRSVNSKRLILTWGSLKPAPITASEEVYMTKPVVETRPVVEVKEVVLEEPVQEVIVEEVPVVEEVKEEVVEEVVEEAPKATKKKTAKKKADKEEA